MTISTSGNQLQFNATTPGFLGLKLKPPTAPPQHERRPLHRRPHHPRRTRHRRGIRAHRTVTVADDTGNQFLENFNFQNGVASIDYLYIYDQGGADYSDGNLKGLLTQSLRYGTVPVVVYYNLQNVFTSTGQSTYVTEGPDSRRISRSTTTTPPANRPRSSTTNT